MHVQLDVTDTGFSPSGKLSSCAYQRALVGCVMYQLLQTGLLHLTLSFLPHSLSLSLSFSILHTEALRLDDIAGVVGRVDIWLINWCIIWLVGWLTDWLSEGLIDFQFGPESIFLMETAVLSRQYENSVKIKCYIRAAFNSLHSA